MQNCRYCKWTPQYIRFAWFFYMEDIFSPSCLYPNNHCMFKDNTSNFYLVATVLNHYLYCFLKAAYKFSIIRNLFDSNSGMEATVKDLCLPQSN